MAQGHPDAAARYSRGNSEWCPGDQDINGRTIETTYIVRAPDNTPFENLDNPVVCAMTFNDYSEEVYPLLNQADGYRDGPLAPEDLAFDDHFRQWASVCTVPWSSVVTGEYLLQVRTNADQSSPPSSLVDEDTTITTGGYNRYAIRAGFGSPSSRDVRHRASTSSPTVACPST